MTEGIINLQNNQLNPSKTIFKHPGHSSEPLNYQANIHKR